MKKILTITIIFLIAFASDSVSAINSVSCAGVKNIPAALPVFISNIVNLIKIATPIVLIIMGMVDFFKASVANDEKGMNEGKTRFIKRTVSGVIVFLVISVVQLVFNAIGTNNTRSAAACIDCFLSGNCDRYYLTCSELTEKDCWGQDSNGDACYWGFGKCIRSKDISEASGCSKYTNKDECNGVHQDILCKWNEYKNTCGYGGKTITCENMCAGSLCDGKNDSYGNVCAWENGKCIIDNKTNCSDYTSKEKCPSSIVGDTPDEDKICNWQNGSCTDVTNSPCSSIKNEAACSGVIENVLCDWKNSKCVQVGVAGNCSKWNTIEDCETFTDDYGNACYWDKGCKNDTSHECSDYTNLTECNAATDSNGNKCLWNISGVCEIEQNIKCSDYTSLTECNSAMDSNGNKCLWDISGVCEIEQNIKCSDYTNRSECNVSVDSDGNRCLWNISSGCEIDDPNALG